MRKQWIAIALGALVLGTNILPTYAKEEPVQKNQAQVLTLAQAIKKAQDHSVELRQNAREYDLNKEKVDFAFNTGIYELWAVNDSNLSSTQKNKRILEEQIAFNVIKAFDSIHYSEEQLIVQKEQKAVQEKLFGKAEIEYQNGRKSTLAMEQAKVELAKTNQSIANLEKDIKLAYSSLSSTLGMTLTNYTLEEVPHTYEPYTTKLTVDQFAQSKASEHIAVWRAAEQIKLANLPIYTNDYMELITKQENRKLAEDQKDLTVSQLEEKIRTLYVDNEKLQADYELLLTQVALEEKQIAANKIYLEHGMIAAIEYEQSLLSYEQNQLKLKQMLNSQVYNATMLKKPYLIPSVSGY